MAREKVDKTEISRYDTEGVNQQKYVSLGKAFANKAFKQQNPWFKHTDGEYARVRQETIKRVKTHFENSKWEDFEDFYNCNRIYLIPLGDITFGDFPELKPIIYHIECFAFVKNGTKFYSFVVERNIFTKFVALARKIPLDKIEIPFAENPKLNYGRDMKLYRTMQVAIGKNRIYTDQTPLIEKLDFWCQTNKIDRAEALGRAIELLFEKHPLDKPLEREPDFFDLLPPISMKDIVQKDGVCQQQIEMPTMVYARLRDIFSNYNRSPENGNKPKMELSNFFLMTTKFFLDNNKAWTLRYGNPEMYAELKKQAEQTKKDLERANQT